MDRTTISVILHAIYMFDYLDAVIININYHIKFTFIIIDYDVF